MAGISAALEIAGMGFKTYLVEKTGKLGGKALKLNLSPTGRAYGNYISKYIEDVAENPLIDVFLNTEVKAIDGYVGKYSTILRTGNEETEVKHGVVIVATGAREYQTKEYLYGSNSRVITQMELEGLLKDGKLDTESLRNVVMIQCVGSRDDKHPYCSRVCCNQAIKNATFLTGLKKDMNITVFYRDIRSYGLNELNYSKARKAGVQFVNYTPDRKPQVFEDERLIIKAYDAILDREITIEADLLVLSSAIEPETEKNKIIAQMLKVPLNQEGFFLEAHVKLRPVDFATEGVYLCGLAHAPKNLKESITQGKAAAARAVTIISKDTLQTEGTIAQVNESLCAGCGACEKICAYKAISVQEIRKRDTTVKKAVVNAILCKGCGTCSAVCRCGAVDINGFTDKQVVSELEYLLRGHSLT